MYLAVSSWGLLANPLLADAHRIRETDWKDGVIILSSQEVLSGQLFHDHIHSLVLLRSDSNDLVKTFTVHQVQSFRYYDPQDNIIHDFLSLAYQSPSSYPMRGFYEVVSEGDVLYVRQHNHCPLEPPREVNAHTIAYNYFAFYRGKLVRAHQFEKGLLPALIQEDPTLAGYMKEQHLKPYDVGDQILLINYFNHVPSVPLADLAPSS